MKTIFPTLLLSIFLLISCQANPIKEQKTPIPPPPTPTIEKQPSLEPTQAVIAAASATATVMPATPSPTPTEAATLPASALFQIPWQETAPYGDSLIPGEEASLSLINSAAIYHIDIKIGEDYQTVIGQEAVMYTNQEDVPLSEVYFRLYPNISDGESVVTNLQINGTAVTPSYELENSAMRVPLAPALQPGDQLVFTMDFAVKVPASAGGNYGIFAWNEEVLALAHFYPMLSVYDDEGWNIEIPPESGDLVYADASFFLVRVTAPESLVIAASGTQLTHQAMYENQVNTYAIGPARDFYLAGSERYVKSSRQFEETTINVYTFAENETRANFSLDVMENALKSFNKRYGVYPFRELDLVSTATLALGIEYTGIIVATNRVFDEEAGYPEGTLETTVAHEVAHQWFYSMVGNDQLDEPWVDESVTQYATLVYYGDTYGNAGIDYFHNSLGRFWDPDSGETIPIGQPVGSYSARNYGSIVYGRGPIFVNTLAEQMGEASFDQFMLDYTAQNKWGIATSATFKDTAEKACDCDLDALFAEWVYGN